MICIKEIFIINLVADILLVDLHVIHILVLDNKYVYTFLLCIPSSNFVHYQESHMKYVISFDSTFCVTLLVLL